jgi:cell division septation protein DedD
MIKTEGGRMVRIGILCILVLTLSLTGCSKKKEEAKALQNEAAQDEAAMTLDTMAQRPPKTDTVAQITPKPATEPTPAETEPAEPEYPQEPGFVVQVGSYLDYDLATSMAARYKDRGYDAFLVPSEIDGKEFYRLRIGVFDTYAEAKQIGEELVDRYSADYWVDNNQ